MDAQLKKGLIEICVLVVLKQQDSYGYQIIKDISDYAELSESTLYPILKRLEAGEFVTTYSIEQTAVCESTIISRTRESCGLRNFWWNGRMYRKCMNLLQVQSVRKRMEV